MKTPWRSASHYLYNELSADFKKVFLDKGSLTRYLYKNVAWVKRSRTQDRVKILRQGWSRIRWSEARLLGLKCLQRVWVREICLFSNQRPFLIARSVFPQDFFSGKTARFQHYLDNRPLGEWLFREPTLKRSAFEIVKLFPHHEEYALLTSVISKQKPYWARRSLFFLYGKSILLMEIFL